MLLESLHRSMSTFWARRRQLMMMMMCVKLHIPGSWLFFRFIYVHQDRLTSLHLHYVLTLSVRSSIRSFVSPNLSTHFENKWTDFDVNWHKWSMWQGHETVNFVVSSLKVNVTRVTFVFKELHGLWHAIRMNWLSDTAYFTIKINYTGHSKHH